MKETYSQKAREMNQEVDCTDRVDAHRNEQFVIFKRANRGSSRSDNREERVLRGVEERSRYTGKWVEWL